MEEELLAAPGSLRFAGLSDTGSVASHSQGFGSPVRDKYLVEERKKVVYESMKKKLEVEAVIRESAMKASRAAEKEAMAIARERGIADRHTVLDALASTLEANAKRLAEEEANVAAARDEAELRARSLAVQAQSIEATDAEQRSTARWLRREASRFEAEERRKLKELEAFEESTKLTSRKLSAKEQTVQSLEERLKKKETTVEERWKSLEEREVAIGRKEKDLATKAEALELETKRLGVASEVVAQRTADIDARAHSVAVADHAVLEKVEALQKRNEMLDIAKSEIDDRAKEADFKEAKAEARLQAAEKVEKELRALEDELEKKKEKAEALFVKATSDAKDAAVSLAVAKKEAEDIGIAAEREFSAQRRSFESKAEDHKARDTSLSKRETQLEKKEADFEAVFKAFKEKEAKLFDDKAKVDAALKSLDVKNKDSDDKSKKINDLENDFQSKFANIQKQAEDFELARKKLHEDRFALEANVAELDRRESNIKLREEKAEGLEKFCQDQDNQRIYELVAVQPWLEARSSSFSTFTSSKDVIFWESPDWLRAVKSKTAGDQTEAHAAVQAAKTLLQKVRSYTPVNNTNDDDTTSTDVWSLLPREVRGGLSRGVAACDKIREACCDLQAALVRRFLRLSAGDFLLENDATCAGDKLLTEILGSLRAIAAQEVVRRTALVAAIFKARYGADPSSCRALKSVPQRQAPRLAEAAVFRLKHNRFECLRLRAPAAKSRFAAATAHWAAPQFRRFLFDFVAAFNGIIIAKNNSRPQTAAAASSRAMSGLFFSRDMGENKHAELRFDDDGDDGRHAPRATCVFENARDLADFVKSLDAQTHGVRCLGIANGFLVQQDDDDDAPPLEVAIVLDLDGQGVLCDLRLRLRALEKVQRHLGSLRFLAGVDSHEEILLPLWRDIQHHGAWVDGLANDLHLAAPSYPQTTSPKRRTTHSASPSSNTFGSSSKTRLSYSTTRSAAGTTAEWPAPPNWTSHAGSRRY